MLVCPNCNHQNPDGAIQCEACYTPLPTMLECPACGAAVQSDASFCGQCGANLATTAGDPASSAPNASFASSPEQGSSDILASTESASEPQGGLDLPDIEIPDLLELDDLTEQEPLGASPDVQPEAPSLPTNEETPTASNLGFSASQESPQLSNNDVASENVSSSPSFQSTQLQTQTVRLIHVQTDMQVEIPAHLSVIHVGKPNERVPPDIDVSGFADSEIVSRVHADIRVEGDSYYLEDVGSSNGTYVNNVPLLPGNRHRLRAGDRIALGKGDKVSFIVQIS